MPPPLAHPVVTPSVQCGRGLLPGDSRTWPRGRARREQAASTPRRAADGEAPHGQHRACFLCLWVGSGEEHGLFQPPPVAPGRGTGSQIGACSQGRVKVSRGRGGLGRGPHFSPISAASWGPWAPTLLSCPLGYNHSILEESLMHGGSS